MSKRIFKLSNGEDVNATDLEKQIENVCHYVKYAVVHGEGADYPVALIFPRTNLLEQPDYEVTPEDGCFCPRTIDEIGRCITGCLQKLNGGSNGLNAIKLKSATIIKNEVDNTNTDNLVDKYKNHLLNMYGNNVPVDEEVYVIKLQ